MLNDAFVISTAEFFSAVLLLNVYFEASVPPNVIFVHVTFFPVPAVAFAALHVPLAVTVSPVFTPLNVIVHDTLAFPLYVLFVHVPTLAVTVFSVMVNVPLLYVIS